MDAILQSGLTPQEIRQRLQAAGYDPRLADQYLSGSAASQATLSRSQPPAAFIDALRSAGILRPITSGNDQSTSDANPEASDIAGASSASSVNPTGESSGELRPFGKTLFGRTATVFDPVTSGPIDASYRIGAGDQLQVVITGSVEHRETNN